MSRPLRGWDTGQTCFDERKGEEWAATASDRAREGRGGRGAGRIREQR